MNEKDKFLIMNCGFEPSTLSGSVLAWFSKQWLPANYNLQLAREFISYTW